MMKRFLMNLAGLLFIAGMILFVGGAAGETISLPCVAIGLGMLGLTAILSNLLERFGALGYRIYKGDDDAEKD